MCLSASVSFGAATLLFLTGSVTLALAQSDSERPFAAIPLLFAIQQFVEGLVWLGLVHGNEPAARALAGLYALFSHLLWPLYVPWAVWRAETDMKRRKLLGWALPASWILGAYLANSLWADPISVQVCEGHLAYAGGRQTVLGPLLMLCYVSVTCGTLLMSSRRALRLFGGSVLASLAVTLGVYEQWLISVWCFFAALLSFLLLWHFVQPAWRSMMRAWV